MMAAPAEQYDHLLPQAPQQQRRNEHHIQQQQQQHLQAQQQRSHPSHRQPHSSQTKPRSYSTRSEQSQHSAGELHETHEEKESKRLHSKADPTLAINEAEPSAVAAMMSSSSVVSLRSMQHKDLWGNTISDPDKSNPTRNRWERPLDTIRGFEAAIDGSYARKTMCRSDTESVANWNRRSSLQPPNQPRFPQESYYGSRPPSFRTDMQYGPMTPGTTRNSYLDAQNTMGAASYGRHPRERGSRMHSEPQYQVYGREQNVYPMPHKDRSYETVTSAAPSGNSDAVGYQTDPTSSDNSSIDRTSPAKRQEPSNDYGIGFSQSQAYQPSNFSVATRANGQNQPLPPVPIEVVQHNPLPPAPQKEPVRLTTQELPDSPEKRKSWFSRRFSKG
ncbi:hypothetical protein CDD81_3048 [Ophiocordyceps australis]|uniref:DUF2406 domain-containing protein n=1 Tax=Ophiocordyceps australis TaxID=1399860 RepID=A0A2C5XCG7_9HYPO|nr:hypothetical protein CDD81_3048 [Ophiocordyceps australis]